MPPFPPSPLLLPTLRLLVVLQPQVLLQLDYDMAAFHVTSYQLLSLITQCHRLRSPVCHLAVASCLPACCLLHVASW